MDVVLSGDVVAFLFIVAILAGFIDSIAGGGGLLTLPALLLVQVPPLSALATNKLQSSFGTLTSSLTMLYKKAVAWPSIRWAFLASLLGSALGTILVHFVDAALLTLLIPVVLIAVALYFGLIKQAGQLEKQSLLTPKQYLYGVVPTIGFYDGFFGPGTGSLFTFANVALMGRTLISATANAKCLNFASNSAALLVFISSGHIAWLLGVVMIGGQVIGAVIGSHVVLSHGQRLIRPLIITVCLLMCAKLLWERFAY
jgi:uncharacterized membrane protein YfcA